MNGNADTVDRNCRFAVRKALLPASGMTGRHRPGRTAVSRRTVMEEYTMGKGDMRSKRGKIYKGTTGKTRPKKKAKTAKAAAAEKK